MKYAVVKVSNGNFAIDSEWDDNRQGAFLRYFDVCKILLNASDVITGTVKVVDENFNTVENKQEYIHHAPVGNEPVEE